MSASVLRYLAAVIVATIVIAGCVSMYDAASQANRGGGGGDPTPVTNPPAGLDVEDDGFFPDGSIVLNSLFGQHAGRTAGRRRDHRGR